MSNDREAAHLPAWQERLFLPGPTPVPWPIAHAMARPMTELRGDRLGALAQRVESGVARLFGTRGRAVAVPGTGTSTMEAVAQSLFSPGDPVLAIVTGAFGARFARVAEAQGLRVNRLETGLGQMPAPEEVATRLRESPALGLLMVHNETSTGQLQPVGQWAAAARTVLPDILCVADAISSVPSVALDMDVIGVDVALAASQKGFMAPPGLGFVALGERGLGALKTDRPGRMYFDLTGYVGHHWVSTPVISHWYAMEASLALLDEEGDEARYARHRTMGRMVRAAGRAMGMAALAPEASASPTVTVLAVPQPLSAQDVLARAGRYGAALAGAMGTWADRAVRIGHVGAMTPLDMMTAVSALEAALCDLCDEIGTAPPSPAGSGVAAALEMLRSESTVLARR